jgi:hypothetical protein
MKKMFKMITVIIGIVIVTVLITYSSIPVNKIGIHSELVMLGDLNGDNKWDGDDAEKLDQFLLEPFSFSAGDAIKVDVNRNGLIDDEDIQILRKLYSGSDPYILESKSFASGRVFPRPREFFKYIPRTEYLKRPLFVVRHAIIRKSKLLFLKNMVLNPGSGSYKDQLLLEIYNEAVRFSLAYEKRIKGANDVEKKYVQEKIDYCNKLFGDGDYFNLLLNIIGLVEDAETLTTKNQSQFIQKILFFRDDLKTLLLSDFYKQYLAGKHTYSEVLAQMEVLLMKNLGMKIDIANLPPPRDLTKLENYIQRAEWQVNKSKSKKTDFERLLLYAQYDPRYLRAVSKTSRKYGDMGVENHNLPMLLLFREALQINEGDKKAAVGMLDEALRIPFAWVKTIPRDKLPSSIALENFLLPGNKEDGSDKSRHWNVFGGLALYKSPEESLRLALAREIKDLRDGNYSPEVMTEFIRDTIANINGIYNVVSMDLNLSQ